MPLLYSSNKCESKSWQKVYFMNQFDKTFSFVKCKNRKQAKSPGGASPFISPDCAAVDAPASLARWIGASPRHYISSGRLMSSSAFTLLMCCLLVIFSGCASLLSGVTSGVSQPTPVIKLKPTPTSSPTTPAPLTNSELAQRIVQGMSLDQCVHVQNRPLRMTGVVC